ncbi:MAG: HEPN domain-containing protein [Chitinophagaceae bacterium]
MVERQELKGIWNIPGDSKSHSGLLTFEPDSNPTLEIIGDSLASFAKHEIELIQGRTTKGFVTLIDVRRQSGSYSNETYTGITKYQPTFIMVGHSYDSVNEIKFDSVKFTAFNLIEWVNSDSITHENAAGNHSIAYKNPVEIPFTISDNLSAKIVFSLDGETADYQKRISLQQSCSIIFDYKIEQPFKTILQDIIKFTGLITLCTYEQSYPVSIEFYNGRLKNNFILSKLQTEVPQAVECFFRSVFYKPTYKQRQLHEHLVQFEFVRANLNSVVQRWYKEGIDMQPVIDLLLRPFRDKYNFSVENFMDVVRAVETFHRRKHNNRVLKITEIEEIKTEIGLSQLDDKLKNVLLGVTNFLHEPSLHQRLEEMINLYQTNHFEKMVTDKFQWIKNVKNSRNYYTHFDIKSEKNALTGKELFKLSESLKVLLLSAVFKCLGIPPAALDKSVEYLIR